MTDGGITVFPRWPGYSPDLNPQENVWSWCEDELREEEDDDISFEEFCKLLLKVVKKYPYAKKLVPGMAKRMQELVDKKGHHIDR